MSDPAFIAVAGLTKRYKNQAVVDGISFAVAEGEFLTMLGPSGGGKTTTLGCIAGFIAPDAGSVRIGGRDMTAVPPHRRGLGMVFQNYALFPHLTVAENVAFGLRVRGTAGSEVVSGLAPSSIAWPSLERRFRQAASKMASTVAVRRRRRSLR